jgi:hypothetical protein
MVNHHAFPVRLIHIFPILRATPLMSSSSKPLMILIAGPYRSGTGDDPALMEKNLRTLEAVALPLYRAGHIPLIGEWIALPLLREAGSTMPEDATTINPLLDCKPAFEPL